MYAWVPTNGPPLMAASCLGKEQLVSCSNEREGGEILTREAELMGNLGMTARGRDTSAYLWRWWPGESWRERITQAEMHTLHPSAPIHLSSILHPCLCFPAPRTTAHPTARLWSSSWFPQHFLLLGAPPLLRYSNIGILTKPEISPSSHQNFNESLTVQISVLHPVDCVFTTPPPLKSIDSSVLATDIVSWDLLTMVAGDAVCLGWLWRLVP